MPLFFAFHVFCFVCFYEQNLHFAPFCLSRRPSTHNFFAPKKHFSPLKTYFLTAISPLLAMFLMALKGFVYTIAADIYTFRLAFSGKKCCIQHHFTLRLAPKRIAFSTKTHCIQRHIALYFATNSPKNGANGGAFK